MKWLMVEDEMIEREGLKKMISHQFSELELVGEAETGNEAVELAKAHNPDFITMDIKMPGMDGVQAVKEIKAWNSDIEIIMMTAYDEFEYAREVMRVGVQEYVLKPSKKAELYEVFQRVIDTIKEKQGSHDQKAILSLVQSNWMQAYFTERIMEHYPEELASFFPESSGEGCAMIVQLEGESVEAQRLWMKEAFERHTYCLVGPLQSGHFPVWIFAFKDSEKLANRSKWIRLLLQRFQSAFQQKATIGIGEFYEDPNHLINSYHEAVIAMAFVNREKGYVFYEEAKSQFHPSALKQASDLVRSWKRVTTKDAISEAEEWIQSHYEEPITLEEVAEYVSLSPYYFSKIFKERLDKSFVEYVADLRVMKAKELLSTTDKPLKEISQLVGYKDPNYFSRVFKKRTNVTPSEFRVPTTTSK